MRAPLQNGGNMSLKTPVAYGVNSNVAARVGALAQLIGKGLPCKVIEVLVGPLVTVQFQLHSIWNIPNITMPLAGLPQYIRVPIQVGDVGYAQPASINLDNITGRSTVIPNAALDGNLSDLSFHPLSGPTWPNLGMPGNSTILYGASGGGVILQDKATGATITVTTNQSGGFVVKQNNLKLTLNGSTIVATNGGTPAAVVTTAGNSPVLFADG